MLPDELVYSVGTIGRKVIHELLQMAGKIDNGRNVSGTEKRLSNCGPRSELHAFLKPGCTAIEEFVWQQAWKDAAHGTCQVRRQSTLTTSYLPKVAVSVPPHVSPNHVSSVRPRMRDAATLPSGGVIASSRVYFRVADFISQ